MNARNADGIHSAEADADESASPSPTARHPSTASASATRNFSKLAIRRWKRLQSRFKDSSDNKTMPFARHKKQTSKNIREAFYGLPFLICTYENKLCQLRIIFFLSRKRLIFSNKIFHLRKILHLFVNPPSLQTLYLPCNHIFLTG